jgi:hypothetical protein
MRGQIETLMKQAGTDTSGKWISVDNAKKLVELVVKECAKVACYHTPDTEELEYSHLIEDKILKHFGVEE